MVNLLSRDWHLHEAKRLRNNMPIKLDAIMITTKNHTYFLKLASILKQNICMVDLLGRACVFR